MSISEKIILMDATLLFLKMCRKYAYANGKVEEGFKTHSLEFLVQEVKTYLEVNKAIFELYGLDVDVL